ncbi:D-alanyl-D-alanine carboxypeptidase/D-alanyl-D-alanine-endopeptidase [Plantactinospora sp. GCM10030261]|uniref:D-alanyl-D-alanine carboxypeptidase/D-alanyl-D-alanine endopeptidase n=1 Tax=Plantactinospora sp. GCM10030261 TaxID=3273420 RepID=UPI003613B030
MPPVGPSPAAEPPASGGPSPERSRRRRTGLVVAVVLLVVALVGGGAAILRWTDDPPPDRVAVGPTAEPTPSPVLAAMAATAPQPTAEGIRAAIEPLITGAGIGGRLNVTVLDAATGQTLYDRGGATATVPASTTKVITAVTVLATRGPAYRIPTRVVAGTGPGEVVLVAGGDPTLASGPGGYYPGAARLDLLANQVKQALGGARPSRVILDTSVYSGPTRAPGWDADVVSGGYGAPATALAVDGGRVDPDPKGRPGTAARFPEPDLAAGRTFAKLLGLPAQAVTRGKAPAEAASGASTSPQGSSSGVPPAAGAELGKVESPPMVRLVDQMLTESDNDVAEALAHQVALARNQAGSFAAAASAMDGVLTELGLDASQADLSDGSGLSRANRLSPELLTQVLALAAGGKRPELGSVFTGLPVAGWSGTLDERYTGPAGTASGAGVVRAKTGTLTGVHAIAGTVLTADGRVLVFAELADGVTANLPQAQQRLDRIAVALSRCGCR